MEPVLVNKTPLALRALSHECLHAICVQEIVLQKQNTFELLYASCLYIFSSKVESNVIVIVTPSDYSLAFLEKKQELVITA